jgi:Leucine-rich repeat (LRR) protein
MNTQILPITLKHAFENNEHLKFPYDHTRMQLSCIKILAGMSNDSINTNIEKIPQELWVSIFSSLIGPRYFKPLFVLRCVCSEFLSISHSMLVTFFHSTTTSNFLLKKINIISPVTKLDLGYNDFICSCTLRKLTNLTHLDLTENSRIKSYDIRHLTNLVSLNLTNNTSIFNMMVLQLANSLTSLSIAYSNKIDNMTINQLTMLTSLDISSNNMISDTAILQLTSLTSLNCSVCSNISDNSISHLTNLKVLNISQTKRVTDQSIYLLTALTELNINNTPAVTDLSVKNLCNLTALYMSSNNSTKESLGHLTNLKMLNIFNTNFTYETIKHLSNLNTLNILETKVNTISSFTNLTTLYANELISQDEIFQLPKISCLIAHTEFVITNGSNRLTLLHAKNSDLTDNILIQFPSLTALYLNDAKLITDKSLQKLTNLKILNLNTRYTGNTGRFLRKLQNLTALNISNKFSFMEFLLNHPSLTHLSTIDKREIEAQIENLGIIFYQHTDWWNKFGPNSSIIRELTNNLNDQ